MRLPYISQVGLGAILKILRGERHRESMGTERTWAQGKVPS